MENSQYSTGNPNKIYDCNDVDYVLVYDISKDNSKEQRQEKRRTFEKNQNKNGVKLSKVDGIEVSLQICEVMKIFCFSILIIYFRINKTIRR